MAINFQHLRAFHIVAACGSFSKAARQLNISQPTLSQQVKTLEGRYGTSLFARGHQALVLTPLGRELFSMTRQMFAVSEQIEELLGDVPSDKPSFVRIASDSPGYAARLAEALLRSANPIEVEVQIGNSREVLERLIDHRVDVAIASDPEIDPRLVYKPLFVDTLNAVIPLGHPSATEPVFPLHALTTECLLLRELSSKTRAATESLLNANNIRPQRIIEVHSREAIREAVAIGIGVSLFFSAECPPDLRLATREIDVPQPVGLTGFLVCANERRRSALMRTVFAATEALEPLLLPSPEVIGAIA